MAFHISRLGFGAGEKTWNVLLGVFLDIVDQRAGDDIGALALVKFLLVSLDKSTSILKTVPGDCHVDLRAGNMRSQSWTVG